jgi:RNA polymerase sigma-70 factor (ECF subfamily)
MTSLQGKQYTARMDQAKTHFVAALYREQAEPLVKYLTSRFQNADEAQEIAQEAWLRIYRLEHPEALDNAKAFLYQTASNVGIDRVRRLQLERRHAGIEHADEERWHTASVEASVDAQKTLITIERALAELPLKCRQAFVMNRQKSLSYPQIARELGVSTSMVEKYIIQALKHFRNNLEQIDD